MSSDKGTDSITCPHCAVRIYVDEFRKPITERVREADEHGPRSYIIIGNNRLLHRCELTDGA